jgi:alkylation response protein AidB-like acyl-CoA dehydrogenase
MTARTAALLALPTAIWALRLKYFGRVSELAPNPALPLVESDEHRLLRESVGRLAAGFGHRYFAEVAAAGGSPDELWQALGEHGFMGAAIATEYGGGGTGLAELAIVEEELAAAGMPMLKLLVSPAVAGAIIERHATEEQKQRWLPGLADGTGRFSLAVTEPDAGSNTHQITTRARRRGDGYVLTGTKTYSSGLEDSDWVLVLANSGEPGENGRARLSLFVVEVDHPQLERFRIPVAIRAPEQTFTLMFDEVELPADRLIGAEGEALRTVFDGLNPERIMSSAMCCGVGRYALAKASAYANEREVWGQPIGAHQGVAHPLAEAKVDLEAARLMMMKAAVLHDAEAPAGEAANMAKLLGADAGVRALDQAIQAHGGNGLAEEYGLADLYFIVRLQKIAPVSREMILNFVAQHSLGLPRSY